MDRVPRWKVTFLLAAALTEGACNIFEPRTPESPAQSGLDFRPPTDPAIVIANLESAVEQKSVANYVSCFADPAKTNRPFSFQPASDASAQYPGLFSSWSNANEQEYFQNLVAKTLSGAFSSLSLVSKSSIITPDSVIYSYDYTFTFEHSVPAFAKTARGSLQFTLVVDNSNFWTISRWMDYASTSDPSWSLFKAKFSN
jgi:hypothetical protein